MSVSPSIADRNLLFGILALQMDFISRDELVAAMNAWVLDKAKPLGQVLRERGSLKPEVHDLLEALVLKHLEKHDGNIERSLAAISSVPSVHGDLARVPDNDLQASLVHLPKGPGDRREHADTFGTLAQEAPPIGSPLRFRILRPHARGGLGEVFVAHDGELHREVALKEIQNRHADHPESRSRFLLEAEITGGLEHPGIVPVYGLGHYADGRPYYAMRFIKGDSLAEAIVRFHATGQAKRDPGQQMLSLRDLLRRFVDVCNAIAYAHSRGVLHRDLKPGNIMLGEYGETLVVDWGLAKAVGRNDECRTMNHELKEKGAGSFEPSLLIPRSSFPQTEMGRAVGTPAYMSPEQAAGRLDELGPASDVYSLGATLYHVLTGHAPFEGANPGEVLRKVERGEFASPRRVMAQVPKALEAICLKAMALRLTDRYATPKELAADVDHWLADEPVAAYPESGLARAARWFRRHRTVAATAATLLLAAAVASTAGAIMVGRKNVEIEGKRREAVAAQEQEAAERTRAEKERDRAEGMLYASNIDRAQQFWNEGNAASARDFLDACREDYRGWEHDYLWTLFTQNQRTLNRRSAPTLCVSWSPDGKRLASGSEDKTIEIWDANHRDALTLKGHEGSVRSVTWSPDGKRLASGGEDITIKIWDTTSGQESLSLKGHTNEVYCVSWSPDGKRLASGSADNTIKVWDATSGRETLTLGGHTSKVLSVSWSPDGKFLASGSWDGTAKVWDATSGQETLTLKGHTSSVWSVSWSPDGKRLASGSADRSVKIWDAISGKEALTLKGHSRFVLSVTWSPDGKRLASGSGDKTIKIWDATSATETLALKGHSDSVLSVSWSPDGKHLASGSEDTTTKIWDATSASETLTLGHTDSVWSVSWCPDGKHLASGSNDRTIKVWDVTSGRETLTLKGVNNLSVWSVSWSPDGRRLASGSIEGRIKIWDAISGQETLILTGHTNPVLSLSWSPDGKYLASGSQDNTIKIWDTTSGQETLTHKGHTDWVWSVSWSPDGKRLASGSADNTIKIWDAISGQETLILTGHSKPVWSVTWSPDGKRLASGSADNTIKIWNATNGQETLTLKGHTDGLKSVSWSPDGKRLASGSSDNTIKIWNTTSGQETMTLKGHARDIKSVSWSPDGKRLASGSWDKTIKIWDGSTSQSRAATGQVGGR